MNFAVVSYYVVVMDWLLGYLACSPQRAYPVFEEFTSTYALLAFFTASFVAMSAVNGRGQRRC